MSPEELRAYHRAWDAAHREEKRARDNAYNAAHREEINARNRAYYAAHREERRAAGRAYGASHSEQRRAYRETHHQDKRARSAALRRVETYVVYRGPEVIYVGRTDHFGYRISQHRCRAEKSLWLDDMTDIAHRYHATYGDSLVDEALLIRLYQPKYNQIGVDR